MIRRIFINKKFSFRFLILISLFFLQITLVVPEAASAAAIPMVSIAFDDGELSVFRNAYPILDSFGIPGTVYMLTRSLSLPPEWKANLKPLENHGWEIGSHSVNHPHLDSITTDEQIYELSKSKADLQALGLSITGFAYPFGSGALDPEIQARVAQYYSYGRSVERGYNSPVLERYKLLIKEAYNTTSVETMKVWVDQAIATNRWLILCLHSVDDSGYEYSISPATLSAISNYIKTKINVGSIRAVTVREGLNLYGVTFPGPEITNIQINPGTDEIEILWTTDLLSTTIADYGLSTLYETTIEQDTETPVTNHSVTISNLSACTTYHYRLRSRDENNNEGFTIDSTFRTSGCKNDPPVISDISTNPSAKNIEINWTTNEAASSFVEFGPTTMYLLATQETDTSPLVFNHSVILQDTRACATYHYRVHSKNAHQSEGVSDDYTVTAPCYEIYLSNITK